MTDRPNVVLIVLDAVRYDHCSYSGYQLNTTPNLDNIRGALYFHKAFSASTWTPPSHASMFTGLYPTQHGVHVGEGGDLYLSLPTFVERLQQMGYATAAFSRNPLLCSITGFGSGFETFYEVNRDIENKVRRTQALTNSIRKVKDPTGSDLGDAIKRTFRMVMRWLLYNILLPLSLGPSYAAETNKQIRSWLLNVKEPFFIFINYLDVHDQNFGSFQAIKRLLAKPNALVGELLAKPSPSIERTRAYDQSLSYLDSKLGDLFRFLESKECMNRTAIIVTSDHGEMLGERGLFAHLMGYPYTPLLHVPLVIKDPNTLHKGRMNVDKVLSLAEIGRIILHMVEGKSCLEYIEKLPDWCGVETMGPIEPRNQQWRRDRQGRKVHLFVKNRKLREAELYRAIITDSYKLIHNFKKGKYELYDLLEDDEKDICDEHKSKFQELFKILKEWEKGLVAVKPPERVFTPEEEKEILRRLKSLGYIA